MLGCGAGAPPGGAEDGHAAAGLEAGSPGRESRWRAVVRVLRSRLLLFSALLHGPDLLIRSVFQDGVATVFPGECRVCEGPLPTLGAAPVCALCLAEAARPRNGVGCSRCGDPLDLHRDMEDLRFRGMECLACRLAPPAFERAVSCGRYADALRELLHLLKYDGMTGLSGLLGDRLAEAVLGFEGEAARELLVVPVPLFQAQERERGYNQAGLLAAAMIRRMRVLRPEWRLARADGILIRQRRTAGQYQLSQRGRRRNLQGAFAVRGDVAGREVLLIDDILTSGATARECARVLRRAGAAKVWVATVARAGWDRETAAADPASDPASDPGAYVAGWDLPAAAVPSGGQIQTAHGKQ